MQDEIKEIMEVSNPLLQKFKDLAPGSFAHCQSVSNILSTVAKSIELDYPDELICAGQFHDVGKIFNPNFFCENLSDKLDPHSDLEPHISLQYITRHVSDTSLILVQNNFPLKVVQLASEHHGSTVVQYFFQKSGIKNKNTFRYKGQPPTTKESAILMIVDSVDATARSLRDNGKLSSPDQKLETIETTITKLINDGQLDNLTIGTLKILKAILFQELNSIYHTRIDYDDTGAISTKENNEIDEE